MDSYEQGPRVALLPSLCNDNDVSVPGWPQASGSKPVFGHLRIRSWLGSVWFSWFATGLMNCLLHLAFFTAKVCWVSGIRWGLTFFWLCKLLQTKLATKHSCLRLRRKVAAEMWSKHASLMDFTRAIALCTRMSKTLRCSTWKTHPPWMAFTEDSPVRLGFYKSL